MIGGGPFGVGFDWKPGGGPVPGVCAAACCGAWGSAAGLVPGLPLPERVVESTLHGAMPLPDAGVQAEGLLMMAKEGDPAWGYALAGRRCACM